MAYKRYIKKNGKIYGPYIYHSHRKDGKVVSKYMGKHEKKKKSSDVWSSVKNKNHFSRLFLPVLLLLFLMSLVILVNVNITGKASLDIKSKYVPGEAVEGNLKLSMKQGELIPADSKLIISLGGGSQEFLLSDLIDEELIEGDFYAEGTNISGSGSGYGLAGSKKFYPEVSFDLRVFDEGISEGNETSGVIEGNITNESSEEGAESENATGGESAVETETNESGAESSSGSGSAESTVTGDSEQVNPEVVGDSESSESSSDGESSVGEESSQESSGSDASSESQASDSGVSSEEVSESSSDTGSDSGASESSGSSGSGSESSGESSAGSSEGNTGGITGAVVSEETDSGEIISGVVSKGSDFTYELADGKSTELVSGSVMSEGEVLDDSAVDVKPKKDIVTVSTDYSMEGKGFGEEYLGNKDLVINIDLGNFGLEVENNSELSVRLVYGDDTIVEASKDLTVSSVVEEENLTEAPAINITENITINETMVNETIILSNLTLEINTTQYGAVLGKPVKWKKNVKADGSGKIKVEIPKQAENITVYKITDDEPEEVSDLHENEEETQTESNESNVSEQNNLPVNETAPVEIPEPSVSVNDSGTSQKKEKNKTEITAKVISGQVTADIELDEESSISGFFSNLFKFFTGRVIDVQETNETKEVVIDENATEFEIEYETPGPVAFEEDTSRGKNIVISSDVHYENILAYTELPREVSRDSIRLYRTTNGSREPVGIVEYADLDNNSLVDYIEWVVPHLSNQSYELIIEITKAEHLDSNRSFISDIYNEVKAKDDVWSEVISDGEYVRVTFEIPLNSERDITLYVRAVNDSASSIEVYAEDSDKLIATFESISEENWHKVYLENLIGTEDVFDLKVLGSVEFDYVVDPSWYDTDWKRRKNITIDNTKVNGTQTNFPVLINISDSDLNSYAQSDGDDIFFTDNNSNKLAHEIEHYNGGNLAAWVKANLSDSADTVLWMYYNNSAASNQENPTAVWDSGYLGVWHLNETDIDGGIGDIKDSTGANNGTEYNMETSDQVPGKIGGSLSFDGTNEYLNISKTHTLKPTSALTLSAWVKMTDYDSDGWNTVFGYPYVDYSHSDPYFEYMLMIYESGPGYAFRVDGQSNGEPISFSTGSWHYLTVTWDGSTTDVKYYLNGAYDDIWDSSKSSITYNYDSDLYFARNGGGNEQWYGLIDESRISNVARSAGWINTSYMNQNSPSTFYSLGGEEVAVDAPSILFVSPTLPNASITSNSYVVANVSITESSLDEFIWNWNGTNFTIMNDSLVAIWNFDNISALGENNTLVKDASGNGNDGICYSGSGYCPAWTSSGKYNGGFTFDGSDDYIDMGGDASISFDASEDYTWSVWVNAGIIGGWPGIIGDYEIDGGNGWGLYWEGTSDVVCVYSYYADIEAVCSSSLNEGADQWYNAVITYSNGDMELFINGTSVDSNTESFTDSGGNFIVGAFLNSGAASYFNGSIDEVRVWNRTLSSSEIQELYMSNLRKYDTDKWTFYISQTENATDVLENGGYTYQAFAIDTSSNENQTEQRNINVNNLFTAAVTLIDADAEPYATGTGYPDLDTLYYNGGKNLVKLNNGRLIAFWESDANDPMCEQSDDNGATWGTKDSYAGTFGGVAVATNGTQVIYVAYNYGTGTTADVEYEVANGLCSISSAISTQDVGTLTDHFHADVAYNGVADRWEVCAVDNDDYDLWYASSPVSSISWTSREVAAGTYVSCSIDVDDNGNVFIATDDDDNGAITVFNSTNQFASVTTVEAIDFVSVVGVNLNIRGNKSLITTENEDDNLLALLYSDDGVHYERAGYEIGEFDSEGCIDENGSFHMVYVDSGDNNIYYIKYSDGVFGSPVLVASNGTARFPSVRCTNFPSANRLGSSNMELVYTDTATNIYFANFTIDTTLDAVPPKIGFNDSITYANGTSTTNTSILGGVEINDTSLDEFKIIYPSISENRSLFNDSLIGMWNFDNVSGIGEYDNNIIDISGNAHGFGLNYGSNLLANPSFETQGGGGSTDAASWGESVDASRSNEWPFSGSWNLIIDNPASAQATTQTVSVDADTAYVLSGRVWSELESTATYLDLNDISEECQTGASYGGQWEHVECNFTTDPSTTSVTVRIIADGASAGGAWWDDIELKPYFPEATWTSGKYGKALDFDGVDDYIYTEDVYDGGSLTVAFWVKPGVADCDDNNNWRSVMRQSDWSYSSTLEGFDIVQEEYGTFVFDIGNGTGENRIGIYPGGEFPYENKWYFLTFTYDENTGEQTAYTNGWWYDSQTIPASPIVDPSMDYFIIGEGFYGTGYMACPDGAGYFKGALDDIQIWDVALSADEVYQLYEANLYKYDSGKWAVFYNNTNEEPFGSDYWTYQAYARDEMGLENFTEERAITLNAINPQVDFELSTPDNNSLVTDLSVEINVSINEKNLDEVKWNWNGTNYTIMNDSLVLMYNFDKVSVLGEDEIISKDLSGNGYDGFLYPYWITDGENLTGWYGIQDGLSSDRKGGEYSIKITNRHPTDWNVAEFWPGDAEGNFDFTDDDYIAFWAKSANGSDISCWLDIFSNADYGNGYGYNFTCPAEWTLIKLNITDPDGIDGSMNLSDVDFFQFWIQENSSVLIDYITLLKENQVDAGRYGNAYYFDGSNDYIQVDSFALKDLSVGFWVNLNSVDGWAGLFSKGPFSSGTNWYLTLRDTDDGNACLVINGITSYCAGSNYLDTGNWHYIVITSSGSDATSYTWNVYKDGEIWISDSDSNDHESNAYDFCIGSEMSGGLCGSAPVNGTIDEVRVWNRTLSSSEIQILYMSNLNKYGTENWNFYINQSKNATAGLDDGIYTYKAFAIDEAGNENSTDVRKVYAGSEPFIPQIGFELPTPSNYTATTSTLIPVNVSISEKYLDEFKWNWNGTNYTIMNDSLVLMMNFDNVGALGECLIRNQAGCVKDLSGNENDGTLGDATAQTDPIWAQSGKYNGAFDFDGVDDFVEGDGIDLADKSFTVSAWAKRKGGLGNYNIFFGLGTVESTDKSLHLGFRDNNNFTCGFYNDDLDAPPVTDYNWHHWVCTYDAITQSRNIFKDGVLVATDTSGSNFSGSGNYQVGETGWYVFRFNGSVDELKVYNRTLSSDEIQILYMSNLNKYDTENWTFYINQTKNATAVLGEGDYTYQAFAKDTSGNENSTETRELTVDLTTPLIDFVPDTPDNGSLWNKSWVDVNVSITETNDHSAFIDWNNSLVGWWSMDFYNDSGVYDNSTYSGFCKFIDGPGTSGIIYGKRGKGMEFNGSTGYYIDCGTNDALNPRLNDYTMMVWVRTSSSQRGYIIDKGAGSGVNGVRLETGDSGYDMKLLALIGNATDYIIARGDTLINDSIWHHVAVVFDRDATAQIYVDGKESGAAVDISPMNGSLVNTTTFLKFSDYSSPFNGSIDEVMVWNRALSEEEINASYNAGVYRLENNFTELSGGDYSYKAYVIDAAGNVNQTETREVTLDTTKPQIAFTEPPTLPDDSTTTNTSVVANVSINETSLDEFIWNWNGTNYTIMNDSLILMYNFDNVSALGENSSYVIDVSGYGNNGEPYFTNIINSTGKYNGGAYFSSINRIISLEDTDLANQDYDAFTISTWYKSNDNIPGNESGFDEYIFWESTSNGGTWPILAFIIDWTGNFGMYVKQSYLNATNGNAYSTTNVVDQEWHHLVAVRTGRIGGTNGSIYVYVDGVLETNNTDQNGGYTLDNAFGGYQQIWIGGQDNWGDEWVDGSLDEFRIYNRTLSSSEIAELYMSNLNKYDTDKWSFYINQSKNATAVLDDGIYTYQAYAIDTSDNENSTEERSLTISTNDAPNNPSPSLTSSDGLHKTTSDLNCSATISDPNADELNVSVRWYKNDALNITLDYNNSYSSGYAFYSILDSSNTSKAENWSCGMRVYDGEFYSIWVNSTSLTINNTLPDVVVLDEPADGNVTINRTPEFSWIIGTDDDDDSLTYDLNLSCFYQDGSPCSDDNRLYESISDLNYVTPNYLKYLKDNNYYYNWTVRANDGEGYGPWATPRKIEVQSMVSLNLSVVNLTTASINFGSMGIGGTNNTTDDNPQPFVIENIGNSMLNVSINASDLWGSVSNPSDYFQYKIDNKSGEEGSFDWQASTIDWAQVPATPQIAIVSFNWSDATDSAEVDILATVPSEEGAGDKDSVIYFSAELGE